MGFNYHFYLLFYSDRSCHGSHGCKSDRICHDCPGIASLMKNYNICVAWHIDHEYCTLKQNLNNFPNICFETIPCEDNNITNALANFGRQNPQLSLYYQGLDRPIGLKKCVLGNIFAFSFSLCVFFPLAFSPFV